MFERELAEKTKTKKITIKKEIVTKTETITMEIPEQSITRSFSFKPIITKATPFVFDQALNATLIDDSECRVELVKLLNLPAIPETSENAFDELDGLFDDLVESGEEVDVVKWVKDLRRRH
jgi:hypothetical protein